MFRVRIFFFSSRRRHTRSVSAFLLNRSSDLLSFISGRLATKSNQIKQLIRNGRSASLQRTFKKSFTSFSHSTRNKTRDGLIRVRNIRALNGRFNTSITHAYSIVIGSKHITLKIGRAVQQECRDRDLHSFPTRRSSDLKSSNLSETAEVPACNVPSRSPLPALAIAPETKLGTASSGLGTLEP